MTTPHYRKIELQSPADLTYLYTNTVALSRRKLDLHLPPASAINNDNTNTNNNTNGNGNGNDNLNGNNNKELETEEQDPMRARVKELVDEFITKTFTTATPSISINGLDTSSSSPQSLLSLSTPETIEYEPYDTQLASRVTSLYAQLESLTTTVAQLRRDAPGRAAREYGDRLRRVLLDDDEDEDENQSQNQTQDEGKEAKPNWNLDVPLGTDQEATRWKNGEMAQVYEDALRTLLRLQGDVAGDRGGGGEEGKEEEEEEEEERGSMDISDALATTVGKAERAERAAGVVEEM